MNPFRLFTLIVFALLAGTLYQAWLLAGQNQERRLVAEQIVSLQQQIRESYQAQSRADAARLALEKAPSPQNDETNPGAAPEDQAGLTDWLRKVDRLKDWLARNPAQRIPEMRYLNSNDWLATAFDRPLETDAQLRAALEELRTLAKAKPEISANLNQAIQAYARDHNGEPISDLAQLRPYLRPALDDEILARYGMVPAAPGTNDGNEVIRQGPRFRGMGHLLLEEKSPADPDYDSQLLFFEQGHAVVGVSAMETTVAQATVAFRKEHAGQQPTQPDQLLPYFTTPVDAKALREYWDVKAGK